MCEFKRVDFNDIDSINNYGEDICLEIENIINLFKNKRYECNNYIIDNISFESYVEGNQDLERLMLIYKKEWPDDEDLKYLKALALYDKYAVMMDNKIALLKEQPKDYIIFIKSFLYELLLKKISLLRTIITAGKYDLKHYKYKPKRLKKQNVYLFQNKINELIEREYVYSSYCLKVEHQIAEGLDSDDDYNKLAINLSHMLLFMKNEATRYLDENLTDYRISVLKNLSYRANNSLNEIATLISINCTAYNRVIRIFGENEESKKSYAAIEEEKKEYFDLKNNIYRIYNLLCERENNRVLASTRK